MKERMLSLLGTAALIVAVAVVLPSAQVFGGGSGGGGDDNPCTEGNPGCEADPPDPISNPANAPCAYQQPAGACTGGVGINCHCNTQGGLSITACVCDDS